jgi:hypothetical protein
MDYQDYLSEIQRRGSHPYSINHCLGVRDAWKWVRKNHWEDLNGIPCDPSTYSKIINSINLFLVNQLLEGHYIQFPHQMGGLKLTSKTTKIALEGGVVKNDYPIDWKRTLRYWYEDSQAREAKQCIKRIQRRKYFIRYVRHGTFYKNRKLYSFRINRSLIKKLGKKVTEERIVAETL